MKAKQITDLESYFTTDNEHWNKYAFETLCQTIQEGRFENYELPLQLFSKSIDLFTEHYQNPLKAVQMFSDELDKAKLDGAQRMFVYERVYDYLQYSEFEKADLTQIKNLLKSQKERQKADKKPLESLTGGIRDTLKETMQKELAALPATLKELEPMQRLNILCKLMPFIVPKVDSVHYTMGEHR